MHRGILHLRPHNDNFVGFQNYLYPFGPGWRKPAVSAPNENRKDSNLLVGTWPPCRRGLWTRSVAECHWLDQKSRLWPSASAASNANCGPNSLACRRRTIPRNEFWIPRREIRIPRNPYIGESISKCNLKAENPDDE